MFQAIILGIVQGVTEFAPISSSGHLIVVPWLFGWDIVNDAELNKTFDVALHMGTLIGAVIYFRKDIWHYFVAFGQSVRLRKVQTTDQRLAWALILGTIPGVIVGVALEDVIQEELGNVVFIAVALAIMGVVLWLVDKRAPNDRDLDDISPRRGLWLGMAQALALQPGISRSGITITAGRLLRLDRPSAARFSFLLSLPIIAGAGLYKGGGVLQDGLPPGMAAPFFWGFVASGISGFLTIWLLLAYLRKRDFTVFMIYRLAVAALVIGVAATGWRPV